VGTIAAAADFPASPDEGDTYLVTADVIDNDATKTNTGENFLAKSFITWSESAWQDGDGQETGIVSVSSTPYTVAEGVHTVLVDTATIAGPSVVNLPALTAARKGRSITVIDAGSGATTYPIAVTPDGADEIDNVGAAKSIDTNDGALRVTTEGTEWFTGPSEASLVAHAATTDNAHGRVREAVAGIDMVTPAANAGTLPGTAGQAFVPSALVFHCTAGASLNGDVTVSLGTTPGGAELMAAAPLTGLDTAEETFRVALTGVFPAIAGNATFDVSVTIGDTGGGATGTMIAYLEGDLV